MYIFFCLLYLNYLYFTYDWFMFYYINKFVLKSFLWGFICFFVEFFLFAVIFELLCLLLRMLQLISWMFISQFGPTHFKEFTHTMTSFTHRRIIFIKHFTIIENLPNIDTEIFTTFVAGNNERKKKKI